MPTKVPAIDFNDLAIEWLPVSHRTPRFIAWHQGMLSGGIAWINKNFWNYCYSNETSLFWDTLITYSINSISITYDGVFISTVNGNLGNNPQQTPSYDPSLTYAVGFSVTYLNRIVNGVQTPIYYICNTPIVIAESFDLNHWTEIPESVWYKIAPSKVGAHERIQYNSQKLTMEYALNRLFLTNFKQPTATSDGSSSGIWYTPTSDIWIQTINYNYASFGVCTSAQASGGIKTVPTIYGFGAPPTITTTDTTFYYKVWIPTSLATALGSSYIEIVSEQVNKMNPLGTKFKIDIY